MNPTQTLQTLDNLYKALQTQAKQDGTEQLLAKAVVWTANDPETMDGVAEADRYAVARRALTLQTMVHQDSGGKPAELWQWLIGED